MAWREEVAFTRRRAYLELETVEAGSVVWRPQRAAPDRCLPPRTNNPTAAYHRRPVRRLSLRAAYGTGFANQAAVALPVTMVSDSRCVHQRSRSLRAAGQQTAIEEILTAAVRSSPGMQLLRNVRVVVAFGGIAWNVYLALLQERELIKRWHDFDSATARVPNPCRRSYSYWAAIAGQAKYLEPENDCSYASRTVRARRQLIEPNRITLFRRIVSLPHR